MVPCVPAWLVIGSINGAPAADSRQWHWPCLPIGRSETHSGPRCIGWEIAILPDNARSLAVVRKVGAHHEGLRERYMYVNGQWRDHVTFALLAEDMGQGFAARLAAAGSR